MTLGRTAASPLRPLDQREDQREECPSAAYYRAGPRSIDPPIHYFLFCLLILEVFGMKSWVLMTIACVLGVAIGMSVTIVERVRHEELFLPAEFAARAERLQNELAASQEQTWAKAEFVNGRVYDFGSMERLSSRTHTFLIKNVGTAPLALTVERTTCKCTISSVNGSRFMPGETGEVTVEWTGNTPRGESEFRQIVELSSNDNENRLISLVITGYVTDKLRVYPPDVIVGRVSSNEGTQTEFRIFGSRIEKIEVLNTEFADTDTADLYEIAYEPLPEEEIEQEKGVDCGLLAKLTIKPGLPLGPIKQTIRIQTPEDKKPIEVLVRGQAVSDIVIASSKIFEARVNRVNFGPLKRTESAEAELQLFVRGEHRHETKISVGEVDPADYLKVHVGPPEELNNGRTIRYKVKIEIPAGLEPINCLGGEYGKHGRVVLQTTHPITKEIPISVRFAVD